MIDDVTFIKIFQNWEICLLQHENNLINHKSLMLKVNIIRFKYVLQTRTDFGGLEFLRNGVFDCTGCRTPALYHHRCCVLYWPGSVTQFTLSELRPRHNIIISGSCSYPFFVFFFSWKGFRSVPELWHRSYLFLMQWFLRTQTKLMAFLLWRLYYLVKHNDLWAKK